MADYDVKPLEGFHPETGLLLAALVDSTREWRENLESPPVEALAWQPSPGSHSIGALILHIVDVESYWFENFAGGRERDPEETKLFLSEETQQYGASWPLPPAQPVEWYFDLHDRIRERSFEALRGIEPDKEFARRDFTCTLRWVVAHVVQHDSYHGGQAVLLHELWKKKSGVQTT
ncbi:MAG: DinB family protein [Armatimonadetes bacterium]|nr:DinB family protein [Armatimonadota bacterium]